MNASPRSRPAPVALVTGGARRIGREIALALAQDGWHVAVHYATSRSEALMTVDELVALGVRAVAVNRDLAVAAGVRSMLAECAAELGPVTCIVNNASLFAYDDAASFDGTLLQQHIAVNTIAPVLLAQSLHARLVEADAQGAPAPEQGVVVNVLDQKLWNPNPDYLSYTLSKAALAEATRLLARALSPRVRVVGIAPGITLPSADQSETEFAQAHRGTPLGASSTPEDIARAVVFLARARSITGTTLLVDGGQHLVPSARDVMFVTREAVAAANASTAAAAIASGAPSPPAPDPGHSA